LVENRNFFIPLTLNIVLKGFPSEYRLVWKNQNGEKSLKIRVTVLTGYRRVTDRRMDRQTSCDGVVRARHTRRAVKIEPDFPMFNS